MTMTTTMLRRIGPLALGWLALACVPSAAGPSLAVERPVVAHAVAPTKSTRERLSGWLLASGLAGVEPNLSAEHVAAARAVGLHAEELIEFLLPVLATCQTEAGCSSTADETDAAAMALLVALDDPRGHQLVGALGLAGNWRASDLVVAVSERRAAAVIEAGACVAPQPAELAAARAGLDDFRVLDRGANNKLLARALTPSELDDLAYFMAAVAEVGPDVGDAWEDHSSPADPTLAPALADARARFYAALQRAELTRAYAAANEYVELLGWPGPMKIDSEPEFAWGGARHSYLLRDMAQIAELVGELEQAQLLYTRANPGGGMCGTSVSARWEEQVRGFIRSAEAAGRCRATVALRLLDLDAQTWWSFGAGATEPAYADGFDYGVRRLAAAGFDVDRLYRGALLTRNRDVDPAELAAALTGPDRELARARIEARGTESWAARIHAIEGFADTHDAAGLAGLVALIEVGDAATRTRAIAAIGAAGRRMFAGACDAHVSSAGGFGSNQWSRAVRPFAVDCATQLDDAVIADLAGQIVEYLRDPDPELRAATATALAELLALSSLDAIRAQVKREAKRVAREDTDSWVLDALEQAIATLEEEAARVTK